MKIVATFMNSKNNLGTSLQGERLSSVGGNVNIPTEGENRKEAMHKLAARIKAVRAEKNMSQVQLATASNKSIKTIQRIERAEGDTTIRTVLHIIKGFKMSMSEFFSEYD